MSGLNLKQSIDFKKTCNIKNTSFDDRQVRFPDSERSSNFRESPHKKNEIMVKGGKSNEYSKHRSRSSRNTTRTVNASNDSSKIISKFSKENQSYLMQPLFSSRFSSKSSSALPASTTESTPLSCPSGENYKPSNVKISGEEIGILHSNPNPDFKMREFLKEAAKEVQIVTDYVNGTRSREAARSLLHDRSIFHPNEDVSNCGASFKPRPEFDIQFVGFGKSYLGAKECSSGPFNQTFSADSATDSEESSDRDNVKRNENLSKEKRGQSKLKSRKFIFGQRSPNKTTSSPNHIDFPKTMNQKEENSGVLSVSENHVTRFVKHPKTKNAFDSRSKSDRKKARNLFKKRNLRQQLGETNDNDVPRRKRIGDRKKFSWSHLRWRKFSDASRRSDQSPVDLIKTVGKKLQARPEDVNFGNVRLSESEIRENSKKSTAASPRRRPDENGVTFDSDSKLKPSPHNISSLFGNRDGAKGIAGVWGFKNPVKGMKGAAYAAKTENSSKDDFAISKLNQDKDENSARWHRASDSRLGISIRVGFRLCRKSGFAQLKNIEKNEIESDSEKGLDLVENLKNFRDKRFADYAVGGLEKDDTFIEAQIYFPIGGRRRLTNGMFNMEFLYNLKWFGMGGFFGDENFFSSFSSTMKQQIDENPFPLVVSTGGGGKKTKIDGAEPFSETFQNRKTLIPRHIKSLQFGSSEEETKTLETNKKWSEEILDDEVEYFPSACVRLRLSLRNAPENRVSSVDCNQSNSNSNLDYEIVQNKLSEDEIRSNVVKEVLNSERDFVSCLRNVVEDYIEPCRKRNDLFTKSQIKAIFSNLEDVLMFQKKFLNELEVKINIERPHESCIGETFTRNKSGFLVYSEYCNSHSAANSTLQRLLEKNEYKKFFENCRSNRDLAKLPLDGYLLTPVQKICRYPMQLAKLLKHTKADHPDRDGVREALETMKQIVSSINEKRRKMEKLEKLFTRQCGIEGWEGRDFTAISSRLIYHGEVAKANAGSWSSNIALFLFDRQLIYCKRDLLRRSFYVYKGRIALDGAKIINLADGKYQQLSGTIKHGIQILNRNENSSFVFCCRSGREKAKWLNALSEERKLVALEKLNSFEFSQPSKELTKTLVNSKIPPTKTARRIFFK